MFEGTFNNNNNSIYFTIVYCSTLLYYHDYKGCFLFFTGQYVRLQYNIYIYIYECAKMCIFNKFWGHGLWAWSDFPYFLSLADHMLDL